MKLFLFIFAYLFLVPQEETKQSGLCGLMVFSDALPVQFWLEGCDTYNESENYGIHPICWIQPFACDDPINIQFHDDNVGVNTEVVSLPSLSSWLSRSTSSSKPDWTTGAAPSVNLPGAGAFSTVESEVLYANYPFISGREYVISITYTRTVNSGSSNPRTTTISIFDDSFNIQFSTSEAASAGSNTDSITFTANSICTKVGISHNSGSDVTITINSTAATISTFTEYSVRIISEGGDTLESIAATPTELASDGYFHTVSFTPSDYNICNQSITIEVWSEGSPESRIARTDTIEISDSHIGTKLISYTNERNFAGLFYENISPAQTFYIRVPCRFFHEQMPQTDEAMELTASIITTSSQKKNQKLFEVEHAPYYVHNKLIEILQHHTLTIDNNTWKKEEAYDINQGTKNWPLKTATCLLTRTNSIVRNVV